MSEKLGISARELLAKVIGNLEARGKTFWLPAKVLVVIADDSDPHEASRSVHIGYAEYRSAALLKLGGKEIVVAFGMKFGTYPPESFDCDVAAVEISTASMSEESEVAAAASDALAENHYFRNSLVYALADGRLAMNPRSPFTGRLASVTESIQEFIVWSGKRDQGRFLLDEYRYRPEFVDILTKRFLSVLAG